MKPAFASASARSRRSVLRGGGRYIALLALAAATAAPHAVQPAPRPSLVVLLIVDQMRTDYLDRGAPHFAAGFRRLTTEGAWFREGAYPYLNTVTCAGHSTIGTGTFPYRHGMILNVWWDRQAGRDMPCTFDPSERNVGVTGTTPTGDSARRQLAPTLASALRSATGGRTVAVSMKTRSAIPLAGSEADAVVWFSEHTGWTTSTAFAKKVPAWVEEFVAANPSAADAGRAWEKLLPAEAYKGSDSAAGERFPPGWSASFPHAITATGPAFFAQWLRTPFADEYLGRLAAAAVDRLSLGRGTGVDLLAVSFSTLDIVGHQYGPDSHEVQDLVIRLDRTVGALLDHLDRHVGRGKYVVALSSDHGVGQLPESIPDGGRQSGAQALAAINNALKPFLGEGMHATQSAYTDLYFAPGVASKVISKPEASAAVIAALQALPGIAHAFFASEVSSAAARTHADPVRRAAALSYHPERSGDILIVPKPGWMLSTSAAATHGTLYPHDQRVPVLFFGAGITASRSDAAATPADIAPTLAALAGVKFTTADGRPLLGAR